MKLDYTWSTRIADHVAPLDTDRAGMYRRHMIFQVIRHEVDLKTNGSRTEYEQDVRGIIGRIAPAKQGPDRKSRCIPDRRERQADIEIRKLKRLPGIEQLGPELTVIVQFFVRQKRDRHLDERLVGVSRHEGDAGYRCRYLQRSLQGYGNMLGGIRVA